LTKTLYIFNTCTNNVTTIVWKKQIFGFCTGCKFLVVVPQSDTLIIILHQQGEQGAPGDPGKAGAQGPVGLVGPVGPAGLTGLMGEKVKRSILFYI
jgi:hypothetical protein